MNLKLEAIAVPVSDVDRAKKFYQEALGFRYRGASSYCIVQLTPPGSEECTWSRPTSRRGGRSSPLAELRCRITEAENA
jgi:catechol 2,3-dioxygenase-like lactoylglutathione lyase family enzyme